MEKNEIQGKLTTLTNGLFGKNELTVELLVLANGIFGKNKLSKLIRAGNKKVPKTTAIFNMGSATDCPSRKLGFCQAVDGKGKNICYAKKSERSYRPGVLPFRRRQGKYWKGVIAERFVLDFLRLNVLKKTPFTAIRFNEAGDFWDQDSLDKAEKIARILNKFGIKVYCYTSRRDLDFSRVNKLVISGSGFRKSGIRGEFKMILDKKDRPKGYGVCPMNCKVCNRCLVGRKTVVIKH